MRYAYLLKHTGDKAELVAHGPITQVKPKYISAKLESGESLVLTGDGIRTKRRGKSGDIDAYLATVAKENKAMLEADARKKKEAPAKPKPNPETKKANAAALASKEDAKATAQKQLNKK